MNKELKDYSYEGRKKLARIYSKVAKMLSDQGFTAYWGQDTSLWIERCGELIMQLR